MARGDLFSCVVVDMFNSFYLIYSAKSIQVASLATIVYLYLLRLQQPPSDEQIQRSREDTYTLRVAKHI